MIKRIDTYVESLQREAALLEGLSLPEAMKEEPTKEKKGGKTRARQSGKGGGKKQKQERHGLKPRSDCKMSPTCILLNLVH